MKMELIKAAYTYFCEFYMAQNEVVKAAVLVALGYITGTILG